MKKLLLFLSMLLTYGLGVCQEPFFQWAKSMGGPGNERVNDLVVDAEGNIYATGYFADSADFDPDTGIYQLNAAGSYDIFVSKFNKNGALLWVHSMGSFNMDMGVSIALDDFGHVYTTGYYNLTVDFDPGADSTIFVTMNGGWNGMFIQKLDTAGNFIWAKATGGTSSNAASGSGIKTDENGNVYITGFFQDTVDFDLGIGVHNQVSIGTSDIYILKLDSTGDFQWVETYASEHPKLLNTLELDAFGHIFITGSFHDTLFVNNATDTLISNAYADVYIIKSDTAGNFIWAKSFGGTWFDEGSGLISDESGNIYTSGWYRDTVDFDPNSGVYELYSTPNSYTSTMTDMYVQKLDSSGNFIWAKSFGGKGADQARSMTMDDLGNLYISGFYSDTVDFDPDTTSSSFLYGLSQNLFILKLTENGDLVWVRASGTAPYAWGDNIAVSKNGDIITSGRFGNTVDFDTDGSVYNISSAGGTDIFIHKMHQSGIWGSVFNDIDQNCNQNPGEYRLPYVNLLIMPGNMALTTNDAGVWYLDSLPIGSYTIYVDSTMDNWIPICGTSFSFAITKPDSLGYPINMSMINSNPCSSPEISIVMPIIRRCMNSNVTIHVGNNMHATTFISPAYIEISLDTHITVVAANMSYVALGNNVYRVDLGDLYPGDYTTVVFNTTVSCTAGFEQTLCVSAAIFPIDSCALDTLPATPTNEVSPCTLPWDKSSLMVESYCENDSIFFIIYNTGDPIDGDMDCFTPVRVYIDGVQIILDSIKLFGGDSIVYSFIGDGRTWRLEADQHPLHPGNSHPNSSIEACGSISNWTPDLINILPHNDADPVIDIFCGLTTGSYDPNDKAGFPTGITDSNFIAPNQQLEYLIRFQNTGNDTAFTVVITDTLDVDLNIFSVSSGAASHNYDFVIKNARVLEWTFADLLLPDSTTNEPESHGFVSFKVDQIPNLPSQTQINNSANIYFDFNAPVITNTTLHTIHLPALQNNLGNPLNVPLYGCDSATLNQIVYTNEGVYYQNQNDSVILVNVSLFQNVTGDTTASACGQFIWNGVSYFTSSTPSHIYPSFIGCDSVVTLDLTIKNSVDTGISVIDSMLLAADSATYQWYDCANNVIVPGAINQSFIPVEPGSYSVIVGQNGCIDTSGCYAIFTSVIPSHTLNENVRVYPNPTTGNIFIQLPYELKEVTVSLRDEYGKLLYEKFYHNTSVIHYDIDYSPGVYVLILSSGDEIKHILLTKL